MAKVMGHRNHLAGVTLLETMIALVILAFLSIILASSMGAGARIMSRSGDVTDEVDRAVARLNLRVNLEHVHASPFPDQTGGGLAGSATEMTFYSFSDDGVFWPGSPVRFTMRSVPDGGITVQANGLSDIDRSEIVRDIVIAAPETQMKISYWGSAKPAELPGWHKTWSGKTGLPDLVKLTFYRTARSMPPLVVRPGKAFSQSEMSLSSLLPPAFPSRP